jgi:hypothetical protein
MQAMQADPIFESAVEHPIDEYLRLCREVTMVEARAASLLAEIEGLGLHEEAGYLTATAMIRDRLGISGSEARRRVAESRGLAEHPVVRNAYERGRHRPPPGIHAARRLEDRCRPVRA